ncbi:MAG: hypothetical protein U0869_21795 [Chloroflexota bacterium]|jgi:hypothetical protein
MTFTASERALLLAAIRTALDATHWRRSARRVPPDIEAGLRVQEDAEADALRALRDRIKTAPTTEGVAA